jgi:hypothetical protein
MEEILNKILTKPDSILALSALIVSIISLILGIVTSLQNRKNNRLNVKPIAYILPPDYENKIAVILQNKGIGPLITKKIEFIGENGITKNHLLDFMPNLTNEYTWSTFSKASKITLLPAEEKILLEFRGDVDDPEFIINRDNIRSELSKIQIKISYTSIFNELFPFKLSYKLSWFGRLK